MNKKTVIQVLIIFLTLLISWLFFLKYFDKNKKIAQDIIIKKENVLEKFIYKNNNWLIYSFKLFRKCFFSR